LGAQTSKKQCFLSAKTKKHLTENNSLRMLNLRNAASATLESRQHDHQHCFLGTQTGKHLLWKQNVSGKKSETIFVSERMFRVRANGATFRETCFCTNVSATMFSRLRGPSRLHHYLWNKTTALSFR